MCAYQTILIVQLPFLPTSLSTEAERVDNRVGVKACKIPMDYNSTKFFWSWKVSAQDNFLISTTEWSTGTTSVLQWTQGVM